MKNSTLIKGTAAIAVGAALLLGGGGTLASWNAEATTAPGTIVSGDLNVARTVAGVWKDRAGATIDITTYKVVPGDKLTFTQDLAVTLVGNKMAANVATTGITATNGFTPANVTVSAPVLTVGGAAVANPLKPTATGADQTVTATITFEFLSSTTGRADTTASYNFNNVAFQLTQVTQAGLS
ncbi:alternate-type signal peptide domain-containing protein [Pseudarthrobacter sp. BRE9]|jgi:alternate signal-mediated exported protein|uniref:alternate-type signal peptide domain-containing protein n=1 Tax=Pseudarthrobacter sp. BRE9 TaxID=2962582 RepID=UPI002882566E|nr:alternate-type signal peptide domain-containing protein [Pseudarthrobacter sp. BRE9]MDT0168051.1 alternate-type signal peptide domain-containing protein [Pseudarthrobacter sp. BRE9]